MNRHFYLAINIAWILVLFIPSGLLCQSPDLNKLFPEITDWQKKGVGEFYTPENLYQYIDGAAENFLNYDFKKLAVQNYLNAQGQSLTVEIYDHGTAENAFGIYSSEKPLAGNFNALGAQGYEEEGILNFHCAAYYVKLNGFDLGSGGKDFLAAIARNIVRNIGGPCTLPDILKAFPLQGKIPNSERFISKNFLGQNFLHSVFSADYDLQAQKFQLFIIRALDSKDARTMLQKYSALDKEKNGKEIKPGPLIINDPYNGPVRLFWRGTFIWGITGQATAAGELVDEIGRNLPQ
jgi:hypothetical protein